MTISYNVYGDDIWQGFLTRSYRTPANTAFTGKIHFLKTRYSAKSTASQVRATAAAVINTILLSVFPIV